MTTATTEKREPKAGDLKVVKGRLCVRRQEVHHDARGRVLGYVVARGKPRWDWVPVWPNERAHYDACTCEPGPPTERCDKHWLRCRGALGEQGRRVKAILAYTDPGPVRREP